MKEKPKGEKPKDSKYAIKHRARNHFLESGKGSIDDWRARRRGGRMQI